MWPRGPSPRLLHLGGLGQALRPLGDTPGFSIRGEHPIPEDEFAWSLDRHAVCPSNRMHSGAFQARVWAHWAARASLP